MCIYRYIKEPESAALVFSKGDHKMGDSHLKIERMRDLKTLFLARLGPRINNCDLREICQSYGEVENVMIIKDHLTNRSKRCGFVKFKCKQDATKAMFGLQQKYTTWVIEWATSFKDPDNLGVDKYTLYIGGLDPEKVTKANIIDRFSTYGDIENVKLVDPIRPFEDQDYHDETDAYMKYTMTYPHYSYPIVHAYAFVKFKDTLSAARALENENGKVWNNYRIKVQYGESYEMKLQRHYWKQQICYPYMVDDVPSASQLFLMDEFSRNATWMPWCPSGHTFPLDSSSTEFMGEELAPFDKPQ